MELVRYEVKKRVAYITLNRPEKRNALNGQMVTALKNAFAQAQTDEQAKVIVLRGEGKIFCAGADLESLQQLQCNTFEENIADSQHLKSLFEQIYACPKVVVAALNGHALAGGCGLATVCDIVFAAEGVKMGYTEVKIGFIPAIVMVFLLRKIGEGRAKEMLLSGELLNAQQAYNYGLINFVVNENELNEAVENYVQKLCVGNSAQAMAHTKQMIAAVQNLDSLEKGLDFAATQNAHARGSADCQRGISAFLNKENLVW
ncbi:methylglutaconyl-CoA hydratase [Flexibacter flexilis DSM 6793]|uniref:Methylglutaconyl-CoA hydratase n=1 Tax=Flexibacter flexilis DSM 6793 TaxID=927664 RepID=A0A1I1DMU5_9BACT|nr:enoyl-CoA hydratase/isomerase family protein [Flexibacter flexilis]SFB76157.1 methylglutaconyl-CoA hydratase [Flexibacter flexilis DSM 6793]